MVTVALVWDASALHHFAKADRIDVLAQLAAPFRNVTTRVVMQELANHQLDAAALAGGWLDTVPIDELPELTAYVEWSDRLGLVDARHAGEATVLAWAQVHDAVAVIDDGEARHLGRKAGRRVHGTLWLVAQAVRSGRETESSVAGLIRAVSDAGARYPAEAVSDFGRWARSQDLLS